MPQKSFNEEATASSCLNPAERSYGPEYYLPLPNQQYRGTDDNFCNHIFVAVIIFVHYCFALFISIVFVFFSIVLYIMLGILNLSVHLNYGTIMMFTQIIELLICVTLGHLHSA